MSDEEQLESENPQMDDSENAPDADQEGNSESQPESQDGMNDGQDASGEALEQAADDSKHQAAGKHILVVEDTRLLRAMLVKIVTEMGHVVEEADNGHYALAMIKRAKASGWEYDLIMTDLMMPEMDGWTLIKQLREKKFFPRIPVIVLTANAGRDSVLKCARMGIANYIVKPFQSARVMETVNKVLNSITESKNDHSEDDEDSEDDKDPQPEDNKSDSESVE